MKCIGVLFLFGLAVQQSCALRPRALDDIAPAAPAEAKDPCPSCKTLWFEQMLDHSQPSDNRTWKQKYYFNDEFFDWTNKTGPVFLYTSGETPMNYNLMSGFHWHAIAQQHGALLLQLEHRYYGDSWPLGEDSLKTENLKYLSSQQALKDIANFIKKFNKEHTLPKNIKWITWGGSYAGSLATWARVKYQDLIFAAVASSAPVIYTVDFPEFFQVAHDAIEGHDKNCVMTIQKAMNQTVNLMKTEKGMEQLNTDYYVCKKLSKNTSAKDISNFYYNILEMLTIIVQYNLETIVPQWTPIQTEICNVMVNESMGTPIQRLNRVVTKNKQACIFYQYDATIKYWADTNIKSDGAGSRTWTYQTCTEFGNLQSTTKTPFFKGLVTPDFIAGECTDLFGKNFNSKSLKQAVDRTMAQYGGLSATKTDRIISTQGSYDPWYPHGISKSNNENSPAFLVGRTAHCQDQFSNAWTDLPEMIAARNAVEEYLTKWLADQ